MRKIIITVCIAGSLIIILSQFGFFEAFLMFLLAGIVPGTSYTVPSSIMYGLLITVISLIIVGIIGSKMLDLSYSLANKYLQTEPKKDQKKHLPKRRYSQI